ncbi:MAG: leader peptidase (prepilin peptidase) / N-methyltransferase [Parcubacteria bacterium C7867-005]|nr:MAG: leader peptidase (prepilin peptidase) / N-methyltransferase [Parcubacteria bacterium C7867-005]
MFILICLFILGAIVGSFLNVVGLRLNSGLTLGGRSFCPVCHKQLSWHELIPIVSYLLLVGRCSKCKCAISAQYPLIEFFTGLVFVTVYQSILVPITPIVVALYALLLIVFCLYIAILIYDSRHKIIPDQLVYASIIFALIYRFINGGTLFDWLAGPIMFMFFAAIWYFSLGRAMGFGDAKLALSIGLLLGAPMGFSAFALSFWIGTLCVLSIMILSRMGYSLFGKAKRLTMSSEIPFAPFLIFGSWISLIYKLDLFHVISLTIK